MKKKVASRKDDRANTLPSWFPGDKLSWSGDKAELRRLYALRITAYSLAARPEIIRLYGVCQRLDHRKLRLRYGERLAEPGSKEARFLSMSFDLTEDDCEFLKQAVRTVLAGEKNAFKALQINIEERQPFVDDLLIAADYELASRIWPRRKVRQWVAEKWAIHPSRVSQCKTAAGDLLKNWFDEALEIARLARVSRELMLAYLFELLMDTTRIKNVVKVNVKFPGTLPSRELATRIGSS